MCLLVSCSSIVSNRSYIEIMEDEPVELFVPGQDFTTIPGDTGEAYRSTTEMKRRVPPTVEIQQQQARHVSLEQELAYLESIQNKRALAQYLKYSEHIGGTSEKIYFLKIRSMQERENYLRYRGIVQETPFYDEQEYNLAANHQEVLIGMSKEQVIRSLGRPIRRDIAGEPEYENERWAYYVDGEAKYIFFEGGKVGGWSSAQ